MYSSRRPASMDVSPMKRIWPSLISVSSLKVSRHRAGTRNGSTPSITSISANAVRSVLLIGSVARPVEAACAERAAVFARRLAARSEVFEKLGIGLDHEHVVLVL